MILSPGTVLLHTLLVTLAAGSPYGSHGSRTALQQYLMDHEECPCMDPMLHPNWRLLDQDTCGRGREDRIIGGTTAELGAFPWIARLGHNGGYYTDFFCGGVLINYRYVLTAAHCVSNLFNAMNIVRLGDHASDSEIDCYDGECADKVQNFYPEHIAIHPKFHSKSYNYDIALVRLDARVHFSDWVSPICMVHGSLMTSSLEKQWVEVAGWGVYDITINEPSEVLEVVRLKVSNQNHCREMYEDIAPINKDQICAGGVIGKDSCGGDSGGPLMKVSSEDGEPKYYVVGIVSFGDKKCGSSTLPGVYTRVASYVRWILDNMEP